MSKFVNILPKVLLWVLMVVSVVAIAMVFLGGSVDPSAEYLEPVYTDVLLYWIGISVGVALLVTLGFALVQLIKGMAKNPIEAIKSLIGPVLLIALLLVGYFGMNNYCFFTSDDIPTFDGAITLAMNQLTNMCMLGIGALSVVAILLIIFAGAFKSKVK